MIYKFLLTSEEIENYKREIHIDADATFYDLHKIIISCNGYKDGEMTSFFMCDDRWRTKEEISLIEIETDSDVDSFVMKDEIISDWIEEEEDKLVYLFDYTKERGFFMELTEMILGKNLASAKCKDKEGEAPPQFIQEMEEVAKPVVTTATALDTDDKFYGDEEYDPEELDLEGFEGLEALDELDDDLEPPIDTELL